MTYEETLNYLYTSVPIFQNSGASAYKPGLDTTITLDNHFGNPHNFYKCIHVGGTNGKGSTSHLLAAILQQAGYKVGLFTSPHLIDFRERIRVNGKKISKKHVVDFIENNKDFFEPLHPSFFELTTIMAFDYFRSQQVDYAIIEVGLGGRLDCTNIINPIISVITNISFDHTQFLGDTLEAIAYEKAGIIKSQTPVVLGDIESPSIINVFIKKAETLQAPLFRSTENSVVLKADLTKQGKWQLETDKYGVIIDELGGLVQLHNAKTVLKTIEVLQQFGIKIPTNAITKAFANVNELTGLMGRWQKMHYQGVSIVCDTGHNVGGWEYLHSQLKEELNQHQRVYMIVGMVNDKDINSVLNLMPKEAIYLFTQASVQRAMPASDFAQLAAQHGLQGETYNSVLSALKKALEAATAEDLIFIGGSTFIVADALPELIHLNK